MWQSEYFDTVPTGNLGFELRFRPYLLLLLSKVRSTCPGASRTRLLLEKVATWSYLYICEEAPTALPDGGVPVHFGDVLAPSIGPTCQPYYVGRMAQRWGRTGWAPQ